MITIMPVEIPMKDRNIFKYQQFKFSRLKKTKTKMKKIRTMILQ